MNGKFFFRWEKMFLLTSCPIVLLHCALASCGEVYCNRFCVWVFVCGWICVCVGGSVTTITRNCVHRSSPNCVCRYRCLTNDHLHLIKFWPSCAPGKGVCDGAKIFGSALLQPARSVCVSLSAFFH